MAYNQNLKIDSIMGIDYSARLFGIVFSDIRLKFLERHTYTTTLVTFETRQQRVYHAPFNSEDGNFDLSTALFHVAQRVGTSANSALIRYYLLRLKLSSSTLALARERMPNCKFQKLLNIRGFAKLKKIQKNPKKNWKWGGGSRSHLDKKKLENLPKIKF